MCDQLNDVALLSEPLWIFPLWKKFFTKYSSHWLCYVTLLRVAIGSSTDSMKVWKNIASSVLSFQWKTLQSHSEERITATSITLVDSSNWRETHVNAHYCNFYNIMNVIILRPSVRKTCNWLTSTCNGIPGKLHILYYSHDVRVSLPPLNRFNFAVLKILCVKQEHDWRSKMLLLQPYPWYWAW